MAGTLCPDFAQQYDDNNGNPLAFGSIETFLSGTSTPVATYADAALSTSNGTTVSLNSSGRPTNDGSIYLEALAYKFILKNAAGTTIKTVDPVTSVGLTALSSSFNDVVNGRLSLTSAVPVTTAEVFAATAVRFVPFRGNRINLYDGTAWNIYDFTELTLQLGSDAADLGYDVFAYISSGAVAIERLAWTNDTTRATALTTQDGVLVKSGDATRRYLGSYRTTGTIGQTEDSLIKRFVWNYYNRVARPLVREEDTDSWAYSIATWRQANANVANQLAIFVGWAEVLIEAYAQASAANTGITDYFSVGIGRDSTSVPLGLITSQAMPVANATFANSAVLREYPTVGYHFYAWLERATANGTTTFDGDSGGGGVIQNGIRGLIEG